MRKKLLSLLVLLMVAVTGAWAQEETLLTTITPTGDGTYSETTAGAVTVTPAGSFFYSGSSYGWRWDSYGSLTVTANEGYTITRCVFIQQGKNQSVTISEAPFALNFEEWVCLENYSMDGVSSIEVYGYAPAEPVASWVGNSAINANGTWYYAGNNFGWCTGGAFNGADLGTITTLSLGGQSQAWAEGNANWNDGNLTMTMGYKIDGGADESLCLNWFEYADNNNKFQSGGSSWAAQDIDISGLTPGNHTIAVWFTRDDKWDSNNSANYVANFTIPTPAATTYNVTFSANGNTKTVENVTLPHTFSCYYNGSIGVGDGELDLIIQELYGFSGGWCDESSPWMDNAVSGVTVGISSDNQYFSISTPFEGTAQVKGWYYRGWEDDFEYTLDIAIAAVEPEPEPQPAGYAVSLKAETADEGNWTAKAGEGEYQSLPLEGVAEGTQVSLKYSGLKKVKSVKAVKKAPAPAEGKTYTNLQGGEVLHVGDKITETEGKFRYTHHSNPQSTDYYTYIRSFNTYEVLRADVVKDGYNYKYTESPDGQYYVLKNTYYDDDEEEWFTAYYFNQDLPVTGTSDGITVTLDGQDGSQRNLYTFWVHEPNQ